MEQQEISIKSDYQQLRNDLLINLIQEPQFRQRWTDLISDEKIKQTILNRDQYPDLISLLQVLPFSAKKQLFEALSLELQNRQIIKPKDKLLETLRQLKDKDTERKIREIFNLPYSFDLDLLSLFLFQVRAGRTTFEFEGKEIQTDEIIEGLIEGRYSPQDLGKILKRKSFQPSRMEIVTERQSPTPLKQSVAEAVSNGIDAILSETEKGDFRRIGQWGLGIKMLLNYLEDPDDVLTVSTTKNGVFSQIKLRKGTDGRVYLRSKREEADKDRQTKGTTLTIRTKKTIGSDLISQIDERLRRRFRFTPEVDIRVNGSLINNYEDLRDVSGQPLKREKTLGEVRVNLSEDEIQISDSGCGMDEATLLSMFTPNLGTKPVIEINEENREQFAFLVEVFYEEGKKEKVVNISRNREVVDWFKTEEERLNLFQKPLFLEIGPFAQSSASREGVRINDHFAFASQRAIDQIITGNLSSYEKIQMINSLVSVFANLGGRKIGEKRQETFVVTRKIIDYAREQLTSLIESLSKEGFIFLPNDFSFSCLKKAEDKKTVFIDPLLFDFKPERLPGFEQITEFISQTGKKLFITDFSDSQKTVVEYEGGYLLDRKVWEKIINLRQQLNTLSEDDPQRQKTEETLRILIETLELRLNQVSTSYDPKEKGHIDKTQRENRIIFKQEKITKESATEEKKEQITWPEWLNEELKDKILNLLQFRKEKIAEDVFSVYFSQNPQDRRVYIQKLDDRLYFFDPETQKLSTSPIAKDVRRVYFSQNPQDKGVYIKTWGDRLYFFDPETQKLSTSPIAKDVDRVYFLPDGKMYINTKYNNFYSFSERKKSFKDQSVIDLLNNLYQISNNQKALVDGLLRLIDYLPELNDQQIEEINRIFTNSELISLFQQQIVLLEENLRYFSQEKKQEYYQRFFGNLLISSFWFSQKMITDQEFRNIIKTPLLYQLDFFNFQYPLDKETLEKTLSFFGKEKELTENFRICFNLINGFFKVKKDKEEREVFLEKLLNIKNNPDYQKYLQSLSSYSEDDLANFFSQEKIELGVSGKALLDYLGKKETMMIEEISLVYFESEWQIKDEKESLFTSPVSLSKILYQTKVQGLKRWEDVVERLNQEETATDLNFEIFRQQILKEVIGQATEEGVSKRELIQNAVDAIRKKRQVDEGRITINLRIGEDGEERYLIEEFSDNGTGILDWLSFFVPDKTTKEKGQSGFFGSGAFKIFEGIDKVLIKSSTGDGFVYYFIVEWRQTEKGKELVITKSKKTQGNFQGTTISRIKKLKKDSLPQLEGAIIKDDYIIFGGLVAGSTITNADGKSIKVDIQIGGEQKPLSETVFKQERVKESFLDFGEIVLVESSLPPMIAHDIGLRMSQIDERYLKYVPQSLQKLLKDKKISIILPQGLPLIKDRSRIANEEDYLDPLARKIAQAVIKLATQELVIGFQKRTSGGYLGKIWKPQGFPDDWFVNPQYSKLYTTGQFEEVKQIINKMNKGELLTPDELSLLNQDFDLESKLAMVMVGLNVVLPDSGETVNLWSLRLSQFKKASTLSSTNSPIQSYLKSVLEREEQEATKLGVVLEGSLDSSKILDGQSIDFIVGKAQRILEDQSRVVEKQQLSEDELRVKKLFQRLADLYGLEIEIREGLGVDVGGQFQFRKETNIIGKTKYFFVLPRESLRDLVYNQLLVELLTETFVHETAHYLTFLTEDNRGIRLISSRDTSLFTHQVDGPFGYFYYQAAEKILREYAN